MMEMTVTSAPLLSQIAPVDPVGSGIQVKIDEQIDLSRPANAVMRWLQSDGSCARLRESDEKPFDVQHYLLEQDKG